MRKAGVPLVYSKGFHPSPNISFGPPLGVGISGLSEYFDMEIIPPFDLVINSRKLNDILPDGIYIKDMAAIPANTKSLSSFITRYEYEIKYKDLSGIYRFLSEKEINIQREKHIINLRPMVEESRLTNEDTITLIVADQEKIKVRLGELLPLIFNTPLERLNIVRVALYGWNDGWTRPLTPLTPLY